MAHAASADIRQATRPSTRARSPINANALPATAVSVSPVRPPVRPLPGSDVTSGTAWVVSDGSAVGCGRGEGRRTREERVRGAWCLVHGGLGDGDGGADWTDGGDGDGGVGSGGMPCHGVA
jgi:hypothetical protein